MGLRVGRYETLGAIASGGMAKVYLGRAVGMAGFERLVAIKLMHPHLAEDPGFVAMFLDEARLAALIRHPNVVATIDVQNSDEGLFLVMEFVEGCPLSALLREVRAAGRTMPLDVAVRLMLDVLAGLHAAHEQQGTDGAPLRLVHRDVSPANVLVGKDGVARITDFGVARAEERISSTRGGELKGKVPYMPPEQLQGLAVDERVDVYAAGVVLWEALVGRRLFRAPNEAALLGVILRGAEQSPRMLRPDVPEPIDRVCMTAVAADRDARFATAADFADALEQAATETGVGVATTRTVAKFVGALDVVRTAQDVTQAAGAEREEASSPSLESGRQLALDSARRSAARSAATEAAAEQPATAGGEAAEPGPTRLEQTPASSHGATGTSAAGALTASSPAVEPGRRRRPGLLIGALLAFLVGVAAAFVYLGQSTWLGSAPAEGGPGSPSGAGSSPTASSVVPSASHAAAASSTSAEERDGGGDAGAAGGTAADRSGTAAPARSPLPGRPKASAVPSPGTAKPAAGATGAPTARPSPTSFRPTTL